MSKFRAAAIAALSSMLALATVFAQAEEPTEGFALLPGEGAVIGTTTGGSFDFSTGAGGNFNYFISGPLRQTENGWLMYDLELGVALDDSFEAGAASAAGGVIYRFNYGEDSVFGANSYIDLGRLSDSSDTMGLISFGVEYEKRPEDWNGGFVQAGANYYIPFDDYTDTAEYGVLGSAPREGYDGYVSYGRSYDGYALLGMLSGFNYLETDTALDLTGYRLDGEVEWTRDLPPGMMATASLGVRDDSRVGTDLAAVFGIGLDYTYGGTESRTVPTHDCAVVRDGVGVGRIDCGEAVIRGMRGAIIAKDGIEAIETREPMVARVVRPRRHLGFGTPFTPIEYKPTLQIVKETASDQDNTFSFTSTAAGIGGLITTVNGIGMGPSAPIEPGTYTLSEIDIPDNYTLDAITCTGATSVDTNLIAGTVDVTVAADQSVVCTFFNGYTAPGGTIQVVKVVESAAAPASDFAFTGSLAALTQTLSGGGGPETIPGTAIEVPTGQYTITEGTGTRWSLTGAACTGADFVQTPNGVTVTVAANEDAICTFTNTYEQPGGTPGCYIRMTITNQTQFPMEFTSGGKLGTGGFGGGPWGGGDPIGFFDLDEATLQPAGRFTICLPDPADQPGDSYIQYDEIILQAFFVDRVLRRSTVNCIPAPSYIAAPSLVDRDVWWDVSPGSNLPAVAPGAIDCSFSLP